MIRRTTWIVFGIFILVTAMAIFLVRSPSSPISLAAVTPSPTATPVLFEGWESSLVTSLELVDTSAGATRLVRQADGTWKNESLSAGVDAGLVEQLLSELLATRILTQLPADYALESLALDEPDRIITLERADGKIARLAIGGLTPTGNGYYVRLDGNPPSAVSKYAVDAVIEQFQKANSPTATPTIGLTPTS